MPEPIYDAGGVQPGDAFEDCRYHPCYCFEVSDDGESIFGISLIDGSTCQCGIHGCGVRKLTPDEVWRWKDQGPVGTK